MCSCAPKLVLAFASSSSSSTENWPPHAPLLETVYEWNRLDYEIAQNDDDDSGGGGAYYDWQNNAVGAVRKYKDSLYLSVPRWKEGVTATLNIINLHNQTASTAKAEEKEDKVGGVYDFRKCYNFLRDIYFFTLLKPNRSSLPGVNLLNAVVLMRSFKKRNGLDWIALHVAIIT
jgi:hypothetical protein